jgi:predicted AAA+ superfamily ATPase
MPVDTNTVLMRVERLLERLEHLLDAADPSVSTDENQFSQFVAYHWEKRGRGGVLRPVMYPHLVDLDDLLGVDFVKHELIRNTDCFVAGHSANNVLLWGERGTGKSSCVKGLIKLFASKGLRVVEIQRNDLMSLPWLVEAIRNLPYRFLVFCDDLSFAEGDASYQELKTLLDGGLEARPPNMLVYATSNRRHLMPERMDDNLGGEIHPDEAVSDKLALADRFGLTLSFTSFDQETYLDIVEFYAAGKKFAVPREELRKEALRWSLYKGQRSGRAARQFVDDLASRLRIA